MNHFAAAIAKKEARAARLSIKTGEVCTVFIYRDNSFLRLGQWPAIAASGEPVRGEVISAWKDGEKVC